MNLADYIQKALGEVYKQNIFANTVFLNDKFALIKRSYAKIENSVTEYPPMICGLAAHLTDELPNDIAFAICKTEAETNIQKARREAKQELLDQMKTMQLGEILDLINSEPI